MQQYIKNLFYRLYYNIIKIVFNRKSVISNQYLYMLCTYKLLNVFLHKYTYTIFLWFNPYQLPMFDIICVCVIYY